jgi:hypothetical protein
MVRIVGDNSNLQAGPNASQRELWTALVTFNWSPRSNRLLTCRSIRRSSVLADRLVAGSEFDPKRKSINLTTTRPSARPIFGSARFAGLRAVHRRYHEHRPASVSRPGDAAYGIAFAQGVSAGMAHLGSCSRMERVARQECLETKSRNLGRAARIGQIMTISMPTK